jgi:hypothetical protein
VHKLRQEILFLQLEDSNYMLGKIEAMQTVTYACKVNFMYVSRAVKYQKNICNI